MPVQGDYMGMMLTIEDLDQENLDFFRYCSMRDFRLQRGKSSGLLRYPPTTACPWTTDRNSEWVSVEGKGVVHSYVEVHHPIQPAFQDKVPYMIILADLDDCRRRICSPRDDKKSRNWDESKNGFQRCL